MVKSMVGQTGGGVNEPGDLVCLGKTCPKGQGGHGRTRGVALKAACSRLALFVEWVP